MNGKQEAEMVGNSKEMALDTQIRRELLLIEKKFEKVLSSLSLKERRKILRKAAKPLRKAAQQKAPIAEEEVFRYNTPKFSDKLRAPKGKGVVVAVYKPGNLKKAIKTMIFRRDKSAVYVGAKYGQTKALIVGDRAGNVDGFYAHFVEFGTIHSAPRPFMRPAFESTRSQVRSIVEEGALKKIREAKRQTGL